MESIENRTNTMDTSLTSVLCPPQRTIDLLDLRKRHVNLMAVEDCKDRLIQDLLFEVETLQLALHGERTKLETERYAFTQELTKCKLENEDLRHNKGKLSFVSILVDGDCMNFNDALVKDGHSGGREAALLLRQSVERYIRNIDPEASPNLQYKVCVYANIPGLEKAYREAKVLSSNETLTPFIRGFNMESSQCDFIDAGNGKECSDVKIRATFERDILDVHCHHIVFCAATDNGYARLLGPHRGTNRITLVEAAPFAWELEQLSSEFRSTKFPAVFRSAKLPAACASSFSATAATAASAASAAATTSASKTTPTDSAPSSASSTPSSSPPPLQDYATIAKANLRLPPTFSVSRPTPSSSQIPGVSSPSSPSSSTSLVAKPSPSAQIIFDISPSVTQPQTQIYYNAHNQRIDPPLSPASSKENYDRLRAAKYCNRYHLQDDCVHGTSCAYRHGRRLTSAQDLHDLRCISRTSVCAEGLSCANRKCVCGHQCPRETWRDHELVGCRFPEEMHGVDRVIVRVD
ncbi:CCCH zinc finger DNA binding protein [Aspergillus saccharolyticus JOP 1030-1]|uniref:C3H1-type domain-containing protein n=1 Tax=Aspergillus saccharolyticus JOP 1030-1 TaxID=1450539 RepID=A0A318ZPB2_9EURO|nr:hypothetical protein BP01DRAFT_388666 [Aspergillus saccharolyticus JOP 1030-1]PYH48827.1 hypothetical protein BP01DRAFT_388666 [Aspergillus saccharolyticus JOP 1030-1]